MTSSVVCSSPHLLLVICVWQEGYETASASSPIETTAPALVTGLAPGFPSVWRRQSAPGHPPQGAVSSSACAASHRISGDAIRPDHRSSSRYCQRSGRSLPAGPDRPAVGLPLSHGDVIVI